VALSILTSAYFVLRDGVTYRDLGPTIWNNDRVQESSPVVHKPIEELGFPVDLRPAA
jgi:hypothetical protein